MVVVLEILAIPLLVAANAFFVIAEYALVTALGLVFFAREHLSPADLSPVLGAAEPPQPKTRRGLERSA